MEKFEDTTEAVEQIKELRLNINLITKAIITEECDSTRGMILTQEIFPNLLLHFFEMIQKKQLKPSDFFELCHHPETFSG